jgi:RimJ/RimL family protein N-acetyltransferase
MNVMAMSPRSIGAQRIPVGRERWVTIRPIESSDRDDLFGFYRGLSPAASFARFMGMGTELAAEAADRFACANHTSADGLVAVLHEAGPDDGRIVGHLCMEPDGTGAEEIAVAVAEGFRGRGIGTALMHEAVQSAHRRRVPRLTATMFATNQAMRRLMLDAGPPAIVDELDAGVEAIELDAAVPVSDRG